MCICHHCIFSIVYAALSRCLWCWILQASGYAALGLKLRGKAKHPRHVTEIVIKTKKLESQVAKMLEIVVSGLGTGCFLRMLIHSPPGGETGENSEFLQHWSSMLAGVWGVPMPRAAGFLVCLQTPFCPTESPGNAVATSNVPVFLCNAQAPYSGNYWRYGVFCDQKSQL